jgi:hypothetical protein
MILFAQAIDLASATWWKQPAQQLIPIFLLNSGGLFQGIMTAVRPIAVVGILFNLYAMIPEFSKTEKLAENITKLFWAVVLSVAIVNANFAKNVAVFQWAAIGGINAAILDNIQAIKDLNILLKNYQGDIQTMNRIQGQVKSCEQIPPILADGTSNPAFADCQNRLKTLIETSVANGSIKNSDLITKLGDVGNAILSGNFSSVGDLTAKAAANFFSGFASPLISMIFSGWRTVVDNIAGIAVFIGILSLPIPLCLSIYEITPLMVWFSGLWGVGIFQFSLSILTKAFEYLTVSYAENVSIYFLDIGVCFLAPVLAGFMAAGGAMAMFKATVGVATEASKMAVEIPLKLMKIAI